MPSSGSFAGFFPSAPSVQQQKRKRQRTTSSANALSKSDLASSNAQYTDSNTIQAEATSENGDKLNYTNRESGDLLNGVGSASSLTSTVSSIFSNGSNVNVTNNYGAGAGLTPLTNHDSSPPGKAVSPSTHHANSDRTLVDGGFVRPDQSAKLHHNTIIAITPEATPPQSRIDARPPEGEVKGIKVVFDPEIETPKDKRKMKPRYWKFGEKVSNASCQAHV